MKDDLRWIAGASHRLAYAVAISSVVWVLAVQPLNLPADGLAFRMVQVLDLPIATASQLLPCDESGLDLWYRVGPGQSSCPHNPGREFFLNHMRIGVPAYVLLLYVPSIFRATRDWWRRRRAPVAGSALLVTALSFLSDPGLGANRGPSTPEERKEAVRLVRALEEDPLSKDAHESRGWLVAWLSEVPDISVQMCPALLGEDFDSDQKHGAELALQQSLSSAAFIIEHPDRAQDRLAVATAGVEGVLTAYESLLTKKPKARSAALDTLLQARSDGKLGEVVARNMKACT